MFKGGRRNGRIEFSSKASDVEKEGLGPLHSFVTRFPLYTDALLKWMVHTYQPLSSATNTYFRGVIDSVTSNFAHLGKDAIVKAMKMLT
jgi:hypothetical protein